ncbi:NAD-dependent epimerase/dehydratase family protein [Candidatus Latescibacterota bacterium]
MLTQEILDTFTGKKVLVTGGTGMIGRSVVQILCDNGAQVKSVSLDDFTIHPKEEHVFGDLTSFEFCKEITADMDFVFHVAGIKGSIEVTKKKPASFFTPLLMMNTNILEASRINNVGKIVYTSSIGAYPSAEIFTEFEEHGDEGPPMDMFPGWAKRMAELQVKAYRIQYGLENFSIVRPCNVYGPGDNFDPENAMVIPSLMCRIINKEDPVLIWGDGSAIRDFAYSEDVAEGIIQAMYYGTGGRYVNLGSGKEYSIKDLVKALNSFIDFNYKFDTTKPSGFPRRVLDLTLAREVIHYNPTTTLRDGLEKTWNWFIENKDEYHKRKNYFTES